MISKVSENPLWEKQIEVRTILKTVDTEHWLQNNVFSLAWWLSLILFISLWFLWWKLADKARLLEIVAYGLMVTIAATVIDIFGVVSVLWGYPNNLLPLLPFLVIVNFSILRVTYMLLYQYFFRWKSFAAATLIIALFCSFIAEPIAVWLGIYQMNHWKYSYSFPVYIILAFSLKWLINIILAKQNNTRKKQACP